MVLAMSGTLVGGPSGFKCGVVYVLVVPTPSGVTLCSSRSKICEGPLLRNTNNEMSFPGLWGKILQTDGHWSEKRPFFVFRGFPDKLTISEAPFVPLGLEPSGSPGPRP